MLLCLITFISDSGAGIILNFFFITLSEKNNHRDKDLLTQVSACLLLLTNLNLHIKRMLH